MSDKKTHLLIHSASEFYEKEEAVAETYTSEQIFNESHKLLQAYREIIRDHNVNNQSFTKRDSFQLQALVIQLRSLNRRSNLRSKLKSDAADIKKKEVEKKHLTLQNLEMELEHLQRSIDDLKAIEFTRLPLVTPEEYVERKGSSLEKYNEMNEHEQQMALMSLELEMRKEFVQNIENRKEQLIEKEQRLEEKEQKLDSLLPQIYQIRKLTQPLLQALELHSVTTAHLERSSRSRYLPPQLSSLYINVTVYNKINEGRSLKFTCTGSLEDAIAFEQTKKEVNNLKRQKSHVEEPEMSEEEEDEEDELMDVDMPDSRSHREKEEEILNQFKQKQKLFSPHPISFTTAIPGDEAHKSNLTFNYLPELDLITVKPTINLKATYDSFLAAETVLDEIYPDDSGDEISNSSACMLMSLAGVKLSDIPSNLGRPYNFAQQLCLVPIEKETDESRNDRFKYFLKTMLKIGDRIKARRVLDMTCRNATDLRPVDTLPENIKKLIPNPDVCVFTSFKLLKVEDILSAGSFSARQQKIVDRLSETRQLQNGFLFVAEIDYEQKPRVYALTHVPRAYPDNEASSMILLVPANEENFEYVAGLEALEMYLNIEVPKLTQNEPEYMLAAQLAFLSSLCEVAQDVSEYDTSAEYTPASSYLNYHSSRLHTPNFDIASIRNACRHITRKNNT